MNFKRVSHVLFDLDGLLIDSEKLYDAAYTTVCQRFNKKFTWDLKKTLLGRRGPECIEVIIEKLDLPITKEEFSQECLKEHKVLFLQMQLMPGAENLVKHLHKNGIPVAVATSSSEDSVYMKMQNHRGFLDLFQHITTGSDPDIHRGKPAPDIFLVCASKFPDKPKPESCLVFEDAVNGVKAAVAANMQVVVVPDPRIEPELLENATLILKSLEEFKPELFGLPSYN